MTEPEQKSGRYRLLLDGRTVHVGRDPACDLIYNAAGVSRRHARITLDRDNPEIADEHSSFGTRVNGRPVQATRLNPGDTITIGVMRLKVSVEQGCLCVEPLSEPLVPHHAQAETETGQIIRLGRDSANDIQCVHPLVSRFHAQLVRMAAGGYVVSDLQSANGTFVNGRPVKRAELADGDILQVGPYRFFIENNGIFKADDYERVKIEAYGITVRRRNVDVLKNVSLAVLPGEFVVILGPSGAGKTTLARALIGRIPVESGRIFINGMPLRQFASAYTSSIGFVAQHNLLHPELTVAETFREQSSLRLPGDSLPAERLGRVSEVMQLLGIEELAGHRVSNLSGGEAKRVHMGIELLSSPALLLLDEPLAGLDFNLVNTFMSLFRKICDRGHTVMLTTHTLERLDLCDRVIFVNKGTVAFNGKPAEIPEAFGAKTIEDVYARVHAGAIPATVSKKQDASQGLPDDERTSEIPVPGRVRRSRGASQPRQLFMLMRRYIVIMARDRRNLLLQFVQAPLITVLLSLVFRPDADYLPVSFYFCIAISAIWIGGMNAVREIATEWEVLLRDYRAGLSPGAYTVSKIAVFSLAAAVQAVLFTFYLNLMFPVFRATVPVMLTMAGGALGGTLLGLAVSAWNGTVGRAISLLPVAFIPQIFFSGVMVPYDRMSPAGRIISYCTASRPVFSLFKRICLLDQSFFQKDDLVNLGAIILILCILTWSGVRRRLSHSQENGSHG